MILVLHEGGLVSMPLLGQVIDPGPVVAVIRGEEVDDVPEAAFGPRRAVVPADAKKEKEKKEEAQHRIASTDQSPTKGHGPETIARGRNVGGAEWE